MKTLFLLLISVFLIGCATENNPQVVSHINAAGFDPTYPGMSNADIQRGYDAGLVKYHQEVINEAGKITYMIGSGPEVPVNNLEDAKKLFIDTREGSLYTGRVKVYRWGKEFAAMREVIMFEADRNSVGHANNPAPNWSGGYQGPTRPSSFGSGRNKSYELIGRTKLLDEIIEELRVDGAKF